MSAKPEPFALLGESDAKLESAMPYRAQHGLRKEYALNEIQIPNMI